MSSNQTTLSTSELVTQMEEFKIEFWNAWKLCKNMLKENGYIIEKLPSTISSATTEIAQKIYNCVVAVAGERMVVKKEFNEEQQSSSNENADNDFELNKRSSEKPKEIKKEKVEEGERVKEKKEEDEEWKDNSFEEKRAYIPLEYKKRVVAIARAHPKWSLATLKKHGASLLKNKSYLRKWEADIAVESIIEKYHRINNMSLKRFEEAQANSEQVSTTILRQWAIHFAHEIKCEKSIASEKWARKFKRKYNLHY